MGKRGPRPLPTAVKELRGTNRADRGVKDEVRPEVCDPGAPEWMSAEAREEWAELVPELVKHGLITRLDRGLMIARCETFAILRKAVASIRAKGIEVELDSGAERPSAGVRNLREAAILLRQLDAEFGLSPAARTRVSPTGETDEQPNPIESLQRKVESRWRIPRAG